VNDKVILLIVVDLLVGGLRAKRSLGPRNANRALINKLYAELKINLLKMWIWNC